PRQCQANHFFHQLRLIQFLLITIVPAIPLVVTNAKMALILIRRRKIWLGPINTAHCIKLYGIHSHNREELEDASQGKMMRNIHRDVQRQERQLTLQLFLVSVTFCFLSLPSVITVGIQVLNNYHGVQYNSISLSNMFHLSLFSFAVNLTINFVIYCLVGKKFRLAVSSLILCKCSRYRRLRSELLSVSESAIDRLSRTKGAAVMRHRPSFKGL
ncbi:hypothetical protein FBUS_02994, partial [Fasciolopsis buskii]